MLAWLSANLVNIALIAALLLMAALILYHLVRDRRKGKLPCGCSCGSCQGCCGCTACRKEKQ